MMVEQITSGMISPAYPVMGTDGEIFIAPMSSANQIELTKLVGRY